MMVRWLRRLLCRCAEPDPTIQNTGYTGGFTGHLVGFSQSADFGEVVRTDQPIMEVHIGGEAVSGPPLYEKIAEAERELLKVEATEAKARRAHLHVVPDETE